MTMLLFAACIDEKEHKNNPRGNFEALWKIMDEHYCFFDYKQKELGVDWDEVHERYSRQVDQGMSNAQLFEVLGNMLSELRDGHVNLASSFDLARNWSWQFQPFRPTKLPRNRLSDCRRHEIQNFGRQHRLSVLRLVQQHLRRGQFGRNTLPFYGMQRLDSGHQGQRRGRADLCRAARRTVYQRKAACWLYATQNGERAQRLLGNARTAFKAIQGHQVAEKSCGADQSRSLQCCQ